MMKHFFPRTCVVPLGLAALLVPVASAQIPEGYEVVTLANDLGIHSRPEINNRSEVVWSSAFPPNAADVWLYSGGTIRRISDPESYDIRPSINNFSAVAWMRCESFFAEECQLAVYEKDQATVVETPFSLDPILNVNDLYQIIWVHDFSETFDNVALFRTNLGDGSTVQLTTSELSNQSPRLNSNGDFVWNRFDFSVSPVVVWVMMSIDGQQFEITDGTGFPEGVGINDSAQIVFRQFDGTQDVIRVWETGVVTTIGPGTQPRISNTGHLTFGRWDEATQIRYQVVRRNGVFRQLPSPLGWWSAKGDINDIGEVVWREIDPVIGDTRIMMLRRIAYPGDFDGDCHISISDFFDFLGCFTGPIIPPEGLDPQCAAGDFDEDEDVDFADFSALQRVFTGPEDTIDNCVPKGSDG